jgi:hypothetical protein
MEVELSVYVCEAPGCGKEPATYGRLCKTHRQRQRRHGDPRQRTVSLGDLKDHLGAIAYRMRRHPNSRVWGIATARWTALVDHCRAEVAAGESGRARQRHDHLATFEILKLSGAVKPEDVWKRVAAVFMLKEARPGTFASDLGFDYQLVRLVRGLADVSFGQSVSPKTAKTKRHYRDLAPGVIERVAAMLKTTLGALGLQLHRLEADIVADRARKAQEMTEALAEITTAEARAAELQMARLKVEKLEAEMTAAEVKLAEPPKAPPTKKRPTIEAGLLSDAVIKQN